MVVKIEGTGLKQGDMLLPIPERIWKYLGWKPGDNLKIELSQVYTDQIIVHKASTTEVKNG